MRSEPYQYIPVKEFSDLYKKFHTGSQMLEELTVPFPKEKSHKAALVTQKYTVSRWELFKAVFAKELLLFKRNSIVTIFKTMQVNNPHHQKKISLNPTDEPLASYSSRLEYYNAGNLCMWVWILISTDEECVVGCGVGADHIGSIHIDDSVLPHKARP